MQRKGLFLLTAILGLAYIFITFYFQVNYPVNNDDLVIEVKDFSSYLEADISFTDYILGRKNHPSIFHRLIVVASYGLFGEINFSAIRIISNVLIAFFIFFLTWFYRANPVAYAIPILLFTPSMAMIYWGSAVTVYPFSMIMLFLIAITLPKARKVWALIAVVLMLPFLTFSFGNGFIGLVFLVPFLIWLGWSRTLAWWHVAIVLVSIFGCIMWNESLSTSQFPSNISWTWEKISFPFAFFGSLASYVPVDSIWPSIVLCLFLFGMITVVKIRTVFTSEKDEITNMFIYVLMIAMVFASGFAAGMIRCQTALFCTPFASRYEIMGAFGLVFSLLLLSNHRKVLWPLFIILTLLTATKYYKNISYLSDHIALYKEMSMKAYFMDIFKTRGMTPGIIKENNAILKKGVEEGLIDLNPPGHHDVHFNYEVPCKQLRRAELKNTRHATKSDYSFSIGRFQETDYDDVYIRIDNQCYLCTPHFNQEDNKDPRYYLITPSIDKSDYALFVK